MEEVVPGPLEAAVPVAILGGVGTLATAHTVAASGLDGHLVASVGQGGRTTVGATRRPALGAEVFPRGHLGLKAAHAVPLLRHW